MEEILWVDIWPGISLGTSGVTFQNSKDHFTFYVNDVKLGNILVTLDLLRLTLVEPSRVLQKVLTQNLNRSRYNYIINFQHYFGISCIKNILAGGLLC